LENRRISLRITETSQRIFENIKALVDSWYNGNGNGNGFDFPSSSNDEFDLMN
jgi:hypothetical protein